MSSVAWDRGRAVKRRGPDLYFGGCTRGRRRPAKRIFHYIKMTRYGLIGPEPVRQSPATVTAQASSNRPAEAMIAHSPGPTAVARPFPSTVATVSSVLRQETARSSA